MDNRSSTRAAKIRQESTVNAFFKTNCLNITLKFIRNDNQLSMEYPEMTKEQVDHLLLLIQQPLFDESDVGFGFKSLYAPLWTALKALSLKYYIEMKTVEIKHDMTRLVLQKIPIKDTTATDINMNKNIPMTPAVTHNRNVPERAPSRKQILKMTRQQTVGSVSSSFKNRCLQELLDFTSDGLKATIILKNFTTDEVEFVKLIITLLKSKKLKDMLSDEDMAMLRKMKAHRGFTIKLHDRRAMASDLRDLTLIKVPNWGASYKASAAYRLLSTQPGATIVYEQNDSFNQPSSSEKSKTLTCFVPSWNQASRNSSVSVERSRNSSIQRIQFQNTGAFSNEPYKSESQKPNTGKKEIGRSKEKLRSRSRKASENSSVHQIQFQSAFAISNEPDQISNEPDQNKSQKQNIDKNGRGRTKEKLLSSSIRANLLEALAVPLECEKGKRMMQLMGWEGGALGVRGEGITEPITLPLDLAQGAGLGHVFQEKNTKKTKAVEPSSAGLDQGKTKQHINTVLASSGGLTQSPNTQNINAVLFPLGQTLNQEKPMSNKKSRAAFRLELLTNILELISNDKNEISFLCYNVNSKVKSFLKSCITSFNQRKNLSLHTYEEQCLVNKIKDRLIQNIAITLNSSVVNFKIILTKSNTVPQLSLKRQLQLRKEVEKSQPLLTLPQLNFSIKVTKKPKETNETQKYKFEEILKETKSLINENQTKPVNKKYELDSENCDLVSNLDFENVCIDTVGIDYNSDCKSNKTKALRVVILKKILELVKGDKAEKVIVFETSINNKEKTLVSNLVNNVSKRQKFSFHSDMEANIYKDVLEYLSKERCLVNIDVQDELMILSKSIYKNRFINSALSKTYLTLDEKDMKFDDTIETEKNIKNVKKETMMDESLNTTDNGNISMDISKTDSLLDDNIKEENCSENNSIILDLGKSVKYCDNSDVKKALTSQSENNSKIEMKMVKVDQYNEIKSEMKVELYPSELSPASSKRYRSHSETFNSQKYKKTKIEEIKKVNIVHSMYPKENITETQVKGIQNLLSHKIDETHFLPLLKCYGVQNGALVYGCHNTESLYWLQENVSVASNMNLKVIDCTDDMFEDNKKHKMRVKMNVFIDESVEKLFKRIELYNTGLNTDMWTLEDEQRLSEYLLLTIDVDDDSFRFICDRNFCLFAGLDMAEFSNIWNE